MRSFSHIRLPVIPTATAPDGSDVRVLLGLGGGSIAHFELAPGNISRAGVHKTVDEVWFFLNGRGEMWLKSGEKEDIVSVERDVCLTIPVGTHFQFRSYGYEPLSALGITMPPWPGEGEWNEVEGKWLPKLSTT